MYDRVGAIITRHKSELNKFIEVPEVEYWPLSRGSEQAENEFRQSALSCGNFPVFVGVREASKDRSIIREVYI